MSKESQESLKKSQDTLKSKNIKEKKASKKLKVKLYQIKRKYGLTSEQYQNLLDKQNQACYICLRTIKQLHRPRKYLCVDHNHKTGEIRGLLCDNCNQTLQRFRDDPNRFERAAQYLKQGTGLYVPVDS